MQPTCLGDEENTNGSNDQPNTHGPMLGPQNPIGDPTSNPTQRPQRETTDFPKLIDRSPAHEPPGDEHKDRLQNRQLEAHQVGLLTRVRLRI